MSNFSQQNIDFSRQTLIGRLTRPIGLIALYPQNTTDTTLSIQILSNATLLSIKYISSSTVTHSITFTGKSVETVVQEINGLGIPIKAIALVQIDSLKQGDLLSIGSTYVKIPNGFIPYDRLTSNGIVLRGKRISIRNKSNSSIKILPPYQEDPSLPWYPRLTNGAFTQKYRGKIYHFYIAEFGDQDWSTIYGKPFKDLRGVEPIILDKGVYQLPRTPVYWNGENILLYNRDLPISQAVVEEIDINNGIFYTSRNFYIQDGFTVDYSYLENSYIYKNININGHFSQNPLILDKFVVIYLLPVESNYTSNKRTVYHVIGDSIDDAVASISVDDPSIPIAVIGAYNIQQVVISDKVAILDTRSKGGGLLSNTGPTSASLFINNPLDPNGQKIEDVYQESYRFWDIGNLDGIPYPGAAAVAVDLPDYLKEALSIDDIRKKTSKFISAGVYPSIKFTEREPPSISGISSQVANIFNLDFSNVYNKIYTTGSVLDSIPSIFTGVGLSLKEIDIPFSILSGNWSGLSTIIPIRNLDNTLVLEVGTRTGIDLYYTKSTAIAYISWQERSYTSYSGIVDNISTYTPWTKKIIYDDKYCSSGHLIKNVLSFTSSDRIKQYKNIKIHSPYVYSGIEGRLKSSITSLVDNIISIQDTGSNTTYKTAISEYYSNVLDKGEVAEVSDYVLTPSAYNSLFNLEYTPLESLYSEDIYQIGYDFINSGCYTSGSYFKYYVQNTKSYTELSTGQASGIFEYNNQLSNLNRYLDFRFRNGIWSGDCDTGAVVSTGILSKIVNSSGTFGMPFTEGVPLYWMYFSSSSLLSGIYISSPASLGTTITEVLPSKNNDYISTMSLPGLYSTVLSFTGSNLISNSYSTTYKNIYDIYDALIVNKIEDRLASTRYYSGLPTTSHWFVGHNKLGQFLGNTLYNLISAYEYLYRYNYNRSDIDFTSTPTGIGLSNLNHMFTGIERCLEAGYDLVYNNVLRGGIVEPSIATTLYGYGWYINNWTSNYGLTTSLYKSDLRDRYKVLFDFGLKQLIKNQLNDDDLLIETTTINSEPGSFSATTPTKILHPIAEALKMDFTGWRGVAETVINSVIDDYMVSGLYYSDPFKDNTTAGKELVLLPAMASIYKALVPSGVKEIYEPIADSFDEVRGAEFLPEFTGYTSSPQTGWKGTINPLAFWKYYKSGDVESALDLVKSYGINTVKIKLDYLYWKYSSGEFNDKLTHFLDSAFRSKIRVLPSLLSNIGSSVSSGQDSDYITYGVTGERDYYSHWITGSQFLTHSMTSGTSYVNQFIDRFSYHPSIIGVTVLETINPTDYTIYNYNTIASGISSRNPTIPIGYSCSNLLNRFEIVTGQNSGEFQDDILTGIIGDVSYSPIYNSRTSYIEYRTNSLFSYFTGYFPVPITKTVILSSYGDGALSDYDLAITRSTNADKPYILSSIFVKSGTNEGILYEDGTSRNSRQLNAIRLSAQSYGLTVTGTVIQRLDFTNKSFYLTGYLPSYTSENLIDELSNWSHITGLSSRNSGEYYRKINLLTEAQASLDTLNYNYQSPTYYVPSILDQQEVDLLNHYRTEWNNHNFFIDVTSGYQLSGSLDTLKHDQFLYDWGVFLNSVCTRLKIND